MLKQFDFTEQEAILEEVEAIAESENYTALSDREYIKRVFDLVVNKDDSAEVMAWQESIENETFSEIDLDLISTTGYTMKELELLRYEEYEVEEREKLPVGWVFK